MRTRSHNLSLAGMNTFRILSSTPERPRTAIHLDILGFILNFFRVLIHAIEHPRRNMQLNGILSRDNLGYAWQCNIFGHYVLVRRPVNLARLITVLIPNPSIARYKITSWRMPISQNVRRGSCGCPRPTRNPLSTQRMIGSSPERPTRTKRPSIKSTSLRASSKSAP